MEGPPVTFIGWFLLGALAGFMLSTFCVRLAVRWGALHTRANCPHAKDIE